MATVKQRVREQFAASAADYVR
ncbi:MAG: hypothetical protein QOG89_2273, partial [Thermomicrobiales bacterium]|nr:hypothetical protein [Thermomicrobiales bacterium]